MIFPVCQGSLSYVEGSVDTVICVECERGFSCKGGILYWLTGETILDDVTEIVKEFHEENPFPGYEEVDTAQLLVEKARRGVFSKLLDDQIPIEVDILAVGCGTGQLNNFLGIRGWKVFGVDICLNSLRLGQEFRDINMLETMKFVQRASLHQEYHHSQLYIQSK